MGNNWDSLSLPFKGHLEFSVGLAEKNHLWEIQNQHLIVLLGRLS